MERNITLDYFKLFLAVLVITIHLPIEPTTPRWLYWLYHEGFSNGLARIAVPSFFILSGYYLDINNKIKVRKYIIHIGTLYIVWMLFYLPYYSFLDFKSMLITLIGGFWHLWYLIALIEAVIIFYVINKAIKKKLGLFIIAFLLFVSGYVLELSYPYANNIDLYKYRNFLFVGLPFLILGHLIKGINISEYQKWVKLILPVFFILFFFEVAISYSYLHIADIYLSLFIICPLLLIFLLNYPQYTSLPNSLGALSLAIYLIHPFIIRIVLDIFVEDTIYLFPLVLILTIFSSCLIIQANKNIKIFL